MIVALSLALSVSSLAAADATSPCTERTKAAIAYSEDSDDSARDAVDRELTKACFVLTEVVGADDAALLDAARAVPARWLLVAKATLAETANESYLPYTKMPAYGLTIDVTAFDTASGQRRGRAMRAAHVVASADKAASSRESVRVIADAVRVLEAQMKEPSRAIVSPVIVAVDRSEVAAQPAPCASLDDVVVLWHKGNTEVIKASITRGLEARCINVKEQFTGDRNAAMEWARDLDLPLLAIKSTVARIEDGAVLSHRLSLTVDIVDAKAEGLKVITHATDARNVLKAADDAEAWSKVEMALLSSVLDKALPR